MAWRELGVEREKRFELSALCFESTPHGHAQEVEPDREGAEVDVGVG
jgi:hypothetical protein